MRPRSSSLISESQTNAAIQRHQLGIHHARIHAHRGILPNVLERHAETFYNSVQEYMSVNVNVEGEMIELHLIIKYE